jgi:hypothetical protein
MYAGMANVQQPASAPETLKELLSLMWRRGIRELRRQIKVAILVAVIGWLLHTFLLVGPNGGFARMASLLSDFLATRGNVIGGTLIWTLVPALAIAVYVQIKRFGLDEYLEGLKNGLPWVRESYKRLGEGALLILLCGALPALGIVALFRNNLLGLILFGCMVVALGNQSESFWFFFLRVVWNDLQRRRRDDKPPQPFDINAFCVGTAGAAFGFLLGFVLPGMRRFGLSILGVVIVVGLALWIYRSQKRGRQPPAGLFLALALACATLLALASPVYADDGGWDESGGSVGEWVRSEGAFRSLLHGVLPAAAATAGFALGNALGTLGDLVKLPQAELEGATEEAPEEAVEEALEGALEEVFEGKGELPVQILLKTYRVELDFAQRTIGVVGEGLNEDTSVVLINDREERFENSGPASWRRGERTAVELPLDRLEGLPVAAEVTVTEGVARCDRIVGPDLEIDPSHWPEAAGSLDVQVKGRRGAAAFTENVEEIVVTTSHPRVSVSEVTFVDAETLSLRLQLDPGAERGPCELTFRQEIAPGLEQVAKVELRLD